MSETYTVSDEQPGKFFIVRQLTNYEIDVILEAVCFLYGEGQALDTFLKVNEFEARNHMHIFDKVRQHMGYN